MTRLLRLVVLALVAAATLARGGYADDEMSALERSFRRASSRAARAAVVVRARGLGPRMGATSSGVVVSAEGLVLSDGDAGAVWRRGRDGGDPEKMHLRDVDVRIVRPDGRSATYPGRVLSRDLDLDTSLIRLEGVPEGGLPWVPPGRSAGLEVGAFLFVAGTTFDENESARPTVTSGVLASIDPPAPGQAPTQGPSLLFTTAAVNQGVNGGPVVDLDGQLVGTVATWVDPDPDAARPMLGRVIPIDRIRAAHARQAGTAALPVYRAPATDSDDPARALEATIADAGHRARAAVVSLEVDRRSPVSSLIPVPGRAEAAELPRWRGRVSGLLVSADGWIVSSLYNFTNLGELVFPSWPAPPAATVEAGIGAVRHVAAHLTGGVRADARLVAYDERLGLVLLKVEPEAVAASRARPAAPAEPGAFRAGRFTVVVGDPFGDDLRDLPLLTFGVLSKRHGDDVAAPWRDEWQTDASGLDVNAGGAVVDLDGRLLGMMQLWYPARHGRHSGVAFVVPWADIQAALPDLRRGIQPRRGLLGVTFSGGAVPRIDSVSADSSAARAGLRPGDLIHRVGGQDVSTVDDVVVAIGVRFEGERFDLTYEREGILRTVTVTLGAR